MKKQFIVIVLVVLVSLIVDYGIRGYYYPQKDDFESSGTGWILKKGAPEFGTTVNVNFSGEKSHYIFKTFKANDDGICGKIIVNGNYICLFDYLFISS